MDTYLCNSVDFTARAWKSFEQIVSAPDFRNDDVEAIYQGLKNNVRSLDFADYLKRYVYEKAQMSGDYKAIPFEEYYDTIVAQFKDNHTPSSFDATTTRIGMAVKNWLTRSSVNRKTVLLLGFGLNMSVEDVNIFLKKGISEQELNPKDPLEVICFYCYKNGLGYPVFERLMREYNGLTPQLENSPKDIDGTVELKKEMSELSDEKDLKKYLAGLKDISGLSKFSRTAKRHFDELYSLTCDMIAQMYTQETVDAEPHTYSAEQITPSDVENVIYAGVPKSDGNMHPLAESTLCDSFQGKRLNRQRLGKLLTKEDTIETEITRFDLITLSFFIYSQRLDTFASPQERLVAFMDETNRILSECFMHELMIQNPYENFVLCCMLADDPLFAYSGVWERSYSKIE